MENSPNNIFLPSGCLTPEALARLENGTLSDSEKQMAISHIQHCELCQSATEGLNGIDFGQMTSDLEEVKRNLEIIRPLDFMHENRGLRFKLRIRILTLLIVAALIGIALWLTTSAPKPIDSSVLPDDEVPFRLMPKDTVESRLEYKGNIDKKAQWEKRVQKSAASKTE